MLGGEVAGLGQPTDLARAIDGRSAHGRSARRISMAGKGVNRMRFRITVHEDRIHQVTANTVSFFHTLYTIQPAGSGRARIWEVGSSHRSNHASMPQLCTVKCSNMFAPKNIWLLSGLCLARCIRSALGARPRARHVYSCVATPTDSCTNAPTAHQAIARDASRRTATARRRRLSSPTAAASYQLEAVESPVSVLTTSL